MIIRAGNYSTVLQYLAVLYGTVSNLQSPLPLYDKRTGHTRA